MAEGSRSPAHPARKVSVDDILAVIGDFGPYQRSHYFLVAASWFACGWVTLSMVFVNSSPMWRRVPGGEVQAGSIPCADGALEFEIVDAWRSVQGEWHLVCGEKWLLGIIDTAGLLNSVFFVGFGIGTSLFGSFADKFGRRKAHFLAGVVASLACFLCALAPGWRLYAACRCLAGAGIGGFGITSYVLASEVIGTSWQGVLGVGQQGFFVLGNVSLSLLAYLVPNWRSLTIITGLSPLLFAQVSWVVAESPRWLLSNGEEAAANHTMADMARGNGVAMPQGCVLAAQSAATKGDALQLFSVPSLRLRIVVMLYIWCANSLVYYGLSLNTENLGGNVYLNFALQGAAEGLSFFVGTRLLDTVGRRRMLSGAMVFSGLACTACLMLPGGTMLTAAATAGKFGIAASFAAIFVYAAELFPTGLRSSAMGMCSTCGRVGGILAPVVVLLHTVRETLPLLVLGSAALTAGLLILVLPETLGKPLPETVADCEPSTTTKETSPHTGAPRRPPDVLEPLLPPSGCGA